MKKKKCRWGQLSHLAHFSHLHNTPKCGQTKHSQVQPWEGVGKAWARQWRRPFSTARNRHFLSFSNCSLLKRAQEWSGQHGCSMQASFFLHMLLGHSSIWPGSPQCLSPGEETFLTCGDDWTSPLLGSCILKQSWVKHKYPTWPEHRN